MKYTSFAIALIFFGYLNGVQGKTYYVDVNAASGGNGNSWKRAFNNLEDALTAVKNGKGSSGDQIWIAKGTYKPTSPTQPNLATFNLPGNVLILGGFKGTESSVLERGICDPNKTILSGDLLDNDGANIKSDNAYHVLTADNVQNVLLNCFSVKNGHAAGTDLGQVSGPPDRRLVSIDYTNAAGAGLLVRHQSNITLSQVNFSYNSVDSSQATIRTNPALGNPAGASGGAAIAAIDENTTVTVIGSSFENNTCGGFGCNGGALNAMLESSFKVFLSQFKNNSADRNGGAIRGKDAHDLEVYASSFENNIITGGSIGDESGGAIGAINSNIKVESSYFKQNASSFTAGGGAIFFHSTFDDSEPYVLNVGNSTFENNSGGYIGGGAINISANNINPATKAVISNNTLSNNVAIGVGGAIYADIVPTVIENSNFNNNQAGTNGGAVFASVFQDSILTNGLLDLSQRSVVSISNSTFKQNQIVGIPVGLPPSEFIFNIFASALSSIFSNGQGSVTLMSPGGGAVASEFSGNVHISSSHFENNSAPNGSGGALLVGGATGTPDAMNQAYMKIENSTCSNNTALNGNNSAVLDPANLGNTPNGVQLDSDGSCL